MVYGAGALCFWADLLPELAPTLCLQQDRVLLLFGYQKPGARHRPGEPACKGAWCPCAREALLTAGGGRGRQTCVSGRRSLKTMFAIQPERRLARETVRWQTNTTAMLLERMVVLEERVPFAKCALATIGATPEERPMQSQCPYQVSER